MKVSAGPGPVLQFPSMVGEWRPLRIGDPGDYTVEVDGQRYYVGRAAEESYTRREMCLESKIHAETRLLFLTALAVARVQPGTQVVTGVPVTQHTEAVKRDLRALLCGRHAVTVNGRQVLVEVPDLLVCPEGAAAFWGHVLDDAGRVTRPDLTVQHVLVLDLGSRTVNYVSLVQGRYRDRDSGTLPYGMLELRLMGSGQEAALARRIVADLSQRLPLEPDTPVLLAGGGAHVLGEALRQHFRRLEIVPSPETANAIGYRRLGVARHAAAHR